MKLGKFVVLQILPLLRDSSLAAKNLPFCRAACLILFVLSLFRYWVNFDDIVTVPILPEPWRIAYSLRTTGHFSDPFDPIATGPTAHLAPALPAFLALVTKLFGVHHVGAYACVFAEVLAMSILVGLLPLVSRVLGMGVLTGV